MDPNKITDGLPLREVTIYSSSPIEEEPQSFNPTSQRPSRISPFKDPLPMSVYDMQNGTLPRAENQEKELVVRDSGDLIKESDIDPTRNMDSYKASIGSPEIVPRPSQPSKEMTPSQTTSNIGSAKPLNNAQMKLKYANLTENASSAPGTRRKRTGGGGFTGARREMSSESRKSEQKSSKLKSPIFHNHQQPQMNFKLAERSGSVGAQQISHHASTPFDKISQMSNKVGSQSPRVFGLSSRSRTNNKMNQDLVNETVINKKDATPQGSSKRGYRPEFPAPSNGGEFSSDQYQEGSMLQMGGHNNSASIDFDTNRINVAISLEDSGKKITQQISTEMSPNHNLIGVRRFSKMTSAKIQTDLGEDKSPDEQVAIPTKLIQENLHSNSSLDEEESEIFEPLGQIPEQESARDSPVATQPLIIGAANRSGRYSPQNAQVGSTGVSVIQIHPPFQSPVASIHGNRKPSVKRQKQHPSRRSSRMANENVLVPIVSQNAFMSQNQRENMSLENAFKTKPKLFVGLQPHNFSQIERMDQAFQQKKQEILLGDRPQKIPKSKGGYGPKLQSNAEAYRAFQLEQVLERQQWRELQASDSKAVQLTEIEVLGSQKVLLPQTNSKSQIKEGPQQKSSVGNGSASIVEGVKTASIEGEPTYSSHGMGNLASTKRGSDHAAGGQSGKNQVLFNNIQNTKFRGGKSASTSNQMRKGKGNMNADLKQDFESPADSKKSKQSKHSKLASGTKKAVGNKIISKEIDLSNINAIKEAQHEASQNFLEPTSRNQAGRGQMSLNTPGAPAQPPEVVPNFGNKPDQKIYQLMPKTAKNVLPSKRLVDGLEESDKISNSILQGFTNTLDHQASTPQTESPIFSERQRVTNVYIKAFGGSNKKASIPKENRRAQRNVKQVVAKYNPVKRPPPHVQSSRNNSKKHSLDPSIKIQDDKVKADRLAPNLTISYQKSSSNREKSPDDPSFFLESKRLLQERLLVASPGWSRRHKLDQQRSLTNQDQTLVSDHKLDPKNLNPEGTSPQDVDALIKLKPIDEDEVIIGPTDDSHPRAAMIHHVNSTSQTNSMQGKRMRNSFSKKTRDHQANLAKRQVIVQNFDQFSLVNIASLRSKQVPLSPALRLQKAKFMAQQKLSQHASKLSHSNVTSTVARMPSPNIVPQIETPGGPITSNESEIDSPMLREKKLIFMQPDRVLQKRISPFERDESVLTQKHDTNSHNAKVSVVGANERQSRNELALKSQDIQVPNRTHTSSPKQILRGIEENYLSPEKQQSLQQRQSPKMQNKPAPIHKIFESAFQPGSQKDLSPTTLKNSLKVLRYQESGFENKVRPQHLIQQSNQYEVKNSMVSDFHLKPIQNQNSASNTVGTASIDDNVKQQFSLVSKTDITHAPQFLSSDDPTVDQNQPQLFISNAPLREGNALTPDSSLIVSPKNYSTQFFDSSPSGPPSLLKTHQEKYMSNSVSPTNIEWTQTHRVGQRSKHIFPSIKINASKRKSEMEKGPIDQYQGAFQIQDPIAPFIKRKAFPKKYLRTVAKSLDQHPAKVQIKKYPQEMPTSKFPKIFPRVDFPMSPPVQKTQEPLILTKGASKPIFGFNRENLLSEASKKDESIKDYFGSLQNDSNSRQQLLAKHSTSHQLSAKKKAEQSHSALQVPKSMILSPSEGPSRSKEMITNSMNSEQKIESLLDSLVSNQVVQAHKQAKRDFQKKKGRGGRREMHFPFVAPSIFRILPPLKSREISPRYNQSIKKTLMAKTVTSPAPPRRASKEKRPSKLLQFDMVPSQEDTAQTELGLPKDSIADNPGLQTDLHNESDPQTTILDSQNGGLRGKQRGGDHKETEEGHYGSWWAPIEAKNEIIQKPRDSTSSQGDKDSKPLANPFSKHIKVEQINGFKIKPPMHSQSNSPTHIKDRSLRNSQKPLPSNRSKVSGRSSGEGLKIESEQKEQILNDLMGSLNKHEEAQVKLQNLSSKLQTQMSSLDGSQESFQKLTASTKPQLLYTNPKDDPENEFRYKRRLRDHERSKELMSRHKSPYGQRYKEQNLLNSSQIFSKTLADGFLKGEGSSESFEGAPNKTVVNIKPHKFQVNPLAYFPKALYLKSRARPETELEVGNLNEDSVNLAQRAKEPENYQKFFYVTMKDKLRWNQLKLKGDARTLQAVKEKLEHRPTVEPINQFTNSINIFESDQMLSNKESSLMMREEVFEERDKALKAEVEKPQLKKAAFPTNFSIDGINLGNKTQGHSVVIHPKSKKKSLRGIRTLKKQTTKMKEETTDDDYGPAYFEDACNIRLTNLPPSSETLEKPLAQK